MKDRVEEIANELLHNYKLCDGTIETAMKIIHLNSEYFSQLKELKDELNGINLEILEDIYMKQRQLLDFVLEEKPLLEKRFKEISKKENIVNSYISQNYSPVFVDKDFN